MPNELGDYQTPANLADKVVKLLSNDHTKYTNIIEPTFGCGSFIMAIINHLPSVQSINGCELNKHHYRATMTKLSQVSNKRVNFNLQCANIFNIDLNNLFEKHAHNLVIGNPPWITVSALSTMESNKIPKHHHLKGLSGFDALTGKANLDLSEYITLMLMNKLNQLSKSSTLALLVKGSVSRNILKYLPKSNLHPSSFKIYLLNAKQYFHVDVNACLLVVRFNKFVRHNTQEANVYNLNDPKHLLYKFGWCNHNFVSNVITYQRFYKYDRKTIWRWRSGVKHDASKIMDLKEIRGKYINGAHELVPIENDLVYPLIKGSDVNKQKIHNFYHNYVIITQKKIGQSTQYIKQKDPKTWKYLMDHINVFKNRKSSVYKHADQFAMFGIGKYSFLPYKVAVASMYKQPFFSILVPKNHKPAMTDDTVYFIGFKRYIDAVIFASVMNSDLVKYLLRTLTFNDAKRPYTKSILERVDVLAILDSLSLNDLNKTAFDTIRQRDVNNFKNRFFYDQSISLF